MADIIPFSRKPSSVEELLTSVGHLSEAEQFDALHRHIAVAMGEADDFTEARTWMVASAVPVEAGASIVVEMLNPPRRFVLPRSHVQAIHKCLGPAQVQRDGRVGVRRSLIHPVGDEA